jgi:hypothetical protein
MDPTMAAVDPAAPRPTSRRRSSPGAYEILGLLGTGGMGPEMPEFVVPDGIAPRFQRSVAVLAPEFSSSRGGC